MSEPWQSDPSPEEEADRRELRQRVTEAARQAGISLERLATLIRRLADNETETRNLLREVYGVPDTLLDDLVRLRLSDLAADPRVDPDQATDADDAPA